MSADKKWPDLDHVERELIAGRPVATTVLIAIIERARSLESLPNENIIDDLTQVDNALVTAAQNHMLVTEEELAAWDRLRLIMESKVVALKYEDADWIRLVLEGVAEHAAPSDLRSARRAKLLAGELEHQLRVIDSVSVDG